MQSTKSQLDNLKKGPRFTSENASEYGRRGQAKSVEAKKLRKRLALLLNQMTEKKITDEEAKEKLEELGFDTEELRNDAVIAVSLFQSAAKGDLNALDRMIEWIDTGIDEQGAKQMSAEEEALTLVRKNYLENISSCFGAITVYALKHRFTHYEASGGRGSANLSEFFNLGEQIVALCDVDRNHLDGAAKKVARKFPKVHRYQDWRDLLDKEKDLDAVVVSTPDHMHAACAIAAMKRGCHVYVEKPLVRTWWEAERFREVAKKCGVVTQMGNNGNGTDAQRHNIEILQSGVLGDISEIHVSTNRPIWPPRA